MTIILEFINNFFGLCGDSHAVEFVFRDGLAHFSSHVYHCELLSEHLGNVTCGHQFAVFGDEDVLVLNADGSTMRGDIGLLDRIMGLSLEAD